jgi:hypothetical protein
MKMVFWLQRSQMRLRVGRIALMLSLLLASAGVGGRREEAPHVGFLCWVSCGDIYHEAFWQALRKLGYSDYKNITFENRAAGGDSASLGAQGRAPYSGRRFCSRFCGRFQNRGTPQS